MRFVLSQYRYNGTDDTDDPSAELLSTDPADSEMQLLVMLDSLGLISPAAYDMPITDVLRQVNNVNGGEVVVSVLMDDGTTWWPGIDPF